MTNETAIHRLLLVRHRKDCTELLAEALDMAIEALSAQPEQGCDECVFKPFKQFQPERKKGRWIELTNTNHSYVCSVCGRMLINITDGKNMVTKSYPFCHCGADMRGDEDETD